MRTIMRIGLTAILPLIGLLATRQPAAAYDQGQINLLTPGSLETGQLEFTVQHRFLGAINDHPANTILGIDVGANPSLAVRAPVWRTIGFDAGYTREHKELWGGASWRWRVPGLPLRGAFGMELYSDKSYLDGVRTQSGFYWLALQGDAIGGILYPAVDGAYDASSGRVGAGIGASVALNGWLGLLSEFVPVVGATGTSASIDDHGVFAGGIKLTTAGHHFVLLLSNSTGIGARRAMQGASSGRMHLGFIIQRRIDFN